CACSSFFRSPGCLVLGSGGRRRFRAAPGQNRSTRLQCDNAGPGELRCLDRRTAYSLQSNNCRLCNVWWRVPAIRTWSTRWLAMYVTGRLRFASNPRRNGGDDQVSLRHPLTVGCSTCPDSSDTLLVCPET